MKTKKFLMLLAAMLLSCTSAFAQNGNNTPVKGDVNEDGTVDVADIVAVIDIMKNGGGTATVGYFYLGTTKPTAANYKTLPGVVTSFASIDDAIGTKASVAAGQTIYMLCPAAWVKGKKVTLEDKSGNIVDFLDEKDETTVSDYVIYKTQVLNAPNDVVLKQEQEYYWYVGTTPIDDTNYNNTTIVSQVTEIPASTNVTLNTDDYLYIVAPKTKTVTVLDANTQGIVNIKTYNSETHTFTYAETFVGDYKIYRSAQPCLGPFIINISDTYYWYVGTVNPMNVNTINPKDIVSDASSMGWRYIGATVPTYTMQNPLWNGQVNEIVFDNYKDITAYIALPNSVIKVRDGFGNDVTGQMKYLGEKEINGVTYTVYQNGNVVMAYSLDCLVY